MKTATPDRVEAGTQTSTHSVVEALTQFSGRWIPGPFPIACILTLFTFGMVIFVQHRTPFEALGYWTEGFWKLLEVAMQMSLILLTGYIIAVSPPATRILNVVAGFPSTTKGAVAMMAALSMGLSWVHWGLGIVGAPIFLRFLMQRHATLDYRLAVAAACLGSATTAHSGLSGPATLLMATPKHFIADKIGVIPMSLTTFSTFNLVLTAAIVAAMICSVILLNPKNGVARHATEVGKEDRHDAHALHSSPGGAASLAGWIETGYTLNLVMGVLGFCGFFALIMKDGFHPSLNLFNFVFVFLALLLHPSPNSFIKAASQGMEYLHGILVQFPFYAGMHGLISLSGLAITIGDWFVSIANANTFPLVIYWYSGILSYFVPSGGSKWVIEAPFVLEAAKSLKVPVPQTIVSYLWGDMSTHFIQPFWVIPLLAIARIQFKEIAGYLVVLFVVSCVITSAALLLMPYVWPYF